MSPSATAPNAPVEAPDKEAIIKRNPHGNWVEVEASRPEYEHSLSWTPTKTPSPHWKAGDGATSDEWKKHQRISIAPYEEGRTTVQNYKLMISTTVPRPIALVSTKNTDGVNNLAPFSYFQSVCADPPLYSLSLVGDQPNDTLRNILDTKECTISLISDWFIEAANFSSVNTPPHLSEWQLCGLTPSPSNFVAPPSVSESAFSVECRLHSFQELINVGGKRTATLVLVEALVFHVREDMIAKDPLKSTVDLKLLRPVWRGGGITYGTCFQGFELPRPAAWRNLKEEKEVADILATL